ncbi:Methyltransferase, FkbM family [Gammaproteobacteria bacterium]
MANIIFFPVLSKESELIDLVSRASWFLTFFPIQRIDILIASEHLRKIEWRVADGMDESIASRFETLRQRVNFVLAKSESDLQTCMSEASIILRWKKDSCPGFVSGATLGNWLKGKKVWEVDPGAVRMEGSFYIEAGLQLTPNKPALTKENQAKFERLSRRLGKFERAYLMATGPSISHYKKYRFDDSLNIVCNSVILDEGLMQTVKPQILVFADPIFHFGPSQYAGAFRKSLIESAKRHDFTICMPFKYYGLFTTALPELADRTIGIPFTKDREWNFSLDRDFNLKTTANILTFLMIPLAGTFAKEIGFLGCDGRPLEENKYFWGHNEKTQINDKMANIREVHPGFFAIDYNDYYLEHCNTLSTQLNFGESKGLRFHSLAFSHIPALKSRIARVWRNSDSSPDPKPTNVILLDPDATDYSGHFMAYNTNLETAIESHGASVQVLCNQQIATEILESHPNYLPKLSINSWFVGRAKNNKDPDRFQTEILPALDELATRSPRSLVYIYVGSVEHAEILAMASRKYSLLYFNINLFWFSFRDLQTDKDFVDRWRPFMQWLDVAGPRFIATVPTTELQQEISQTFGVILDVAPHPSTAVPDSGLPSADDVYTKAPRLRARVLFPGALRPEKGYQSTLDCIRLLQSDLGIETILRFVQNPSTVPEFTGRPIDLPKNTTMVEGVLTNEAFGRLFEDADAVVLPYSAEAFRNRTSGLLIDALAYGLPAVVVEGTWLANHVRHYECGVVVPDGSPASLVEGIRTIAADVTTFQRKARAAALAYFSKNSWSALADFLFRPFQTPPSFSRLIGIDLTPIGGVTATGRVKEAFFRGWPSDQLTWINFDSETKALCVTNNAGCIVKKEPSEASLLSHIKDFKTEIIYYRAVDNDTVHSFASAAIKELKSPYVIHLMDDWPKRLETRSPTQCQQFDPSLRILIRNSSAACSIGRSMSAAFTQRYRKPFYEFSNAVDPASFPPRTTKSGAKKEFVICYAGALAEDMTLTSVTDFAKAVEELPKELNAYLHIHTRHPWSGIAKRAFCDLQHTRVKDQAPETEYYELLQNADALLISYNFDKASTDYIGYSIANKMPESLASGTPIIAYGPSNVATIEYLHNTGAALVIEQQDQKRLVGELTEFIRSRPRQFDLGAKGRDIAFQGHNLWQISSSFRKLLQSAIHDSQMQRNDTNVLLGPYSRSLSAHWDETEGVAEIFSSSLTGSTMIDVGGHHGSALMPFLNKGWKIFAFEPDEKNRAKLLERLAKHKNRALVSLDIRCVSNKSQNAVSFYRSEQSTGISGLSAFHESHVEAQRVDTITLTEFFRDKALQSVDFLKIDTEGHDLFVLQGYPWDRVMPAVIECEFEDTKTVPLGYNFHDLAGFLVAKGYTVYVSEWHPIIRYGIRHDWNRLSRYPCELADPKGWGNLLAFLNPISEDVLVSSVEKILKFSDARPSNKAPSSTSITPGTDTSLARESYHGFQIAPGTHFSHHAGNQWSYSHSNSSQKIWIAAMEYVDSTSGRGFSGGLRLGSNRLMTVKVSLGRHGNSNYEGVSRTIRLSPNTNELVKLNKDFSEPHTALKLQIEVLELEDDKSATLAIDELYINESLASIDRRVGSRDLTLRQANIRYRQGDLWTAMGMYLLLSQKRPLRLYSDNALMAARKLGLRNATLENLIQRAS